MKHIHTHNVLSRTYHKTISVLFSRSLCVFQLTELQCDDCNDTQKTWSHICIHKHAHAHTHTYTDISKFTHTYSLFYLVFQPHKVSTIDLKQCTSISLLILILLIVVVTAIAAGSLQNWRWSDSTTHDKRNNNNKRNIQ